MVLKRTIGRVFFLEAMMQFVVAMQTLEQLIIYAIILRINGIILLIPELVQGAMVQVNIEFTGHIIGLTMKLQQLLSNLMQRL